MPIPRKRRLKRPGWPEAVLALLVLAVVVPAFLWLQADLATPWERTGGQVVEGEVIPTHYNAERYDEKVSLSYEYTVAGVPYSGRYEGFWPPAGTVNALPHDELKVLERPGYPLIVFYDPRQPARSNIHRQSSFWKNVYAVWFIAALGVTLLYLVRVYPRVSIFRRRH